ncbi:hypothetical protein CerSpe_215110 [Prunus speciosa]
MADLDPRLGKMAAEDGALLRPAMEGSRHLPLDQAVRSAARHGSVALGRGLVLLVVTTNTMNLRFGMMTPTVLDMAALFGLSPLGVEVNAALVAPEVEGSFKATWPTLT